MNAREHKLKQELERETDFKELAEEELSEAKDKAKKLANATTYMATDASGRLLYSGPDSGKAVGAARHNAWLHRIHTRVDEEGGRTIWASWSEGGWRRDALRGAD